MDIISIIILSIGLSMDAFAVSISNGLIFKDLNLKKILLISSLFGFFHILMPLVGWFVGVGIEVYINEFDHWIAFVLLLFIGGKMIYEAFINGINEQKQEFKITIIIGQAFATSIDALAIGVSFALLKISIISPILIIGLTTFVFSIVGLQLGKYFGNKIGKSIALFGGIVLIGIGIKILVEHLYF